MLEHVEHALYCVPLIHWLLKIQTGIIPPYEDPRAFDASVYQCRTKDPRTLDVTSARSLQTCTFARVHLVARLKLPCNWMEGNLACRFSLNQLLINMHVNTCLSPK